MGDHGPYEFGFLSSLIDIHFPVGTYASGFNMLLFFPFIRNNGFPQTLGFTYTQTLDPPQRPPAKFPPIVPGYTPPGTIDQFGTLNFDTQYTNFTKGPKNKDMPKKLQKDPDNLPQYRLFRHDVGAMSAEIIGDIATEYDAFNIPPGTYKITVEMFNGDGRRLDFVVGVQNATAYYQAHGMERLCMADIRKDPNFPPTQDFSHAIGPWFNYNTNVLFDSATVPASSIEMTVKIGETCSVEMDVLQYSTDVPQSSIPTLTKLFDKDFVQIPKKK